MLEPDYKKLHRILIGAAADALSAVINKDYEDAKEILENAIERSEKLSRDPSAEDSFR